MKRKFVVVLLFLVALYGVPEAGGDSNPYSSVAVGDIFKFGGHDWRVLDIQDGKALILSDRVLTKQQYHSSSVKATWESCSLRKYLNGSFYDNTFSAKEKGLIEEAINKNKDNQWYGTVGGIDTIDKIFLLSLEEVVQYFGDSGQLSNRPSTDKSYIDDQYNSARVAYLKDDGAAHWWWLRSPHDNTYAGVHGDGRVDLGSYDFFTLTWSGGVRPALWLNLERQFVHIDE